MRLAMTRSLRMDSSSAMADNRFDDPARRLADQHARADDPHPGPVHLRDQRAAVLVRRLDPAGLRGGELLGRLLRRDHLQRHLLGAVRADPALTFRSSVSKAAASSGALK